MLRRLADGTYGFTIDVEAVADGAEYRLTRDTLLLPEQSPPQFVRAQVLADFSPGRAIENNAELLARQREGVAARTLSNRVTMGAVLRDLVPTLTAQSVVGFGDAELVRAMHSVLPIAIPGRVDWYVQPEPLYRTTTLTKEATLVETRIDGTGEWQFAIGREELPGFYDVLAIQPTDASGLLGGYPLLSDVRGVDLSGDGFRPDIADAIEGVYSRYQTAVIRFHDPDTVTTALEIGATASYAVACRHAEGILAMQNWVEAEATRYHGGDALVKAAVPCFLQIAFRVDQPITQDEIDVPSLQGELAAFVNTLGFTGQVSAAQIADIASNYFQKPAIIKEIELLGTIRTPAGELVTIFDRDVLTIPERPLEMVTPRTTVFQLPPSGIGIDVRRF